MCPPTMLLYYLAQSLRHRGYYILHKVGFVSVSFLHKINVSHQSICCSLFLCLPCIYHVRPNVFYWVVVAAFTGPFQNLQVFLTSEPLPNYSCHVNWATVLEKYDEAIRKGEVPLLQGREKEILQHPQICLSRKPSLQSRDITYTMYGDISPCVAHYVATPRLLKYVGTLIPRKI